MPAGRYRTLITIEKSTRTTSTETGERLDKWSGWITRRASVKAVSARELQDTDTVSTVLISHTVRLRYDAQTKDILQGMRIRIEARDTPREILHIESVINVDERSVELELRCVQRSIPQ